VKIFHEHVINVIMDDFVKACDPLKVEIEGDFHVRGNNQDCGTSELPEE